MRKNVILTFTILGICLTGCTSKEVKPVDTIVTEISSEIETSSSDIQIDDIQENIISAMYIPIENNYIFASEQSGIFTIIDDEITVLDSNNNEIKFSDLKAGNIVEIYSSGMMLESYPGQLTEVTKIKIIETGNPENITKYQDIIDELVGYGDSVNEYEIPYLNVEYKTSLANISVLVENSGNYNWNIDGNDVIACGIAPYDKNANLVEVNIEDKTEIQLVFSNKNVLSLTINKYDLSSVDKKVDEIIPESVSFSLENNIYTLDVEPAIYEVNAEFENGTVSYYFVCKY